MTAVCLMNTYKPMPLSFIRGEGARLWDDSGRQYLDAVAGVAVTNVGHSHPKIVAAISEQAGLLLHTSNHYRIDWQQKLAQRLTQLSGLEQVFFNNSGAEANETALKLARLYGWAKGIEHPLVLVMDNAFHGRTLGTLSASDNGTARLGYQPMSAEFVKVAFGDIVAIKQATRVYGERIVAVLVEPLQGEGGVALPPPGYLKALRGHCTQNGWLMMLDEIQTGIGRTGRWFAYQHEGIVPDVMTLAKALGNGIPIGACLATAAVARLFTPGSHGSTFGGNPLACRVGCTVLDIVEGEGLLHNAAVQGERLLAGLRTALAGHPDVAQVRGMGLMIGIELTRPIREVCLVAAREYGVLINVTRGQTIRLLPPLVIDAADVDRIVAGVVGALGQRVTG
ncbi:aspartate aminotransferase family protein [Pseudomonas graminis]|uniref:Acetylornithine aminotransferase n=1 Tax=Pseudomonas graminis TaxID=158627 RepID=A0A6M8MU99_9PSED|nr:aspartate aminotransferase family protein [Pseudomonas graminis]QKF53351.1 Acetylornithine aminotransferase [Pseudomonas graminis]